MDKFIRSVLEYAYDLENQAYIQVETDEYGNQNIHCNGSIIYNHCPDGTVEVKVVQDHHDQNQDHDQYQDQEIKASDLRDGAATKRYVNEKIDAGHALDVYKEDGCFFAERAGGTVEQITQEEYQAIKPVGAHKLDLRMAAIMMNRMQVDKDSKEYDAIKRALNSASNLRVKTNHGNKDKFPKHAKKNPNGFKYDKDANYQNDAVAEAAFAQFFEQGDLPGNKWTAVHDNKLAQYISEYNKLKGKDDPYLSRFRDHLGGAIKHLNEERTRLTGEPLKKADVVAKERLESNKAAVKAISLQVTRTNKGNQKTSATARAASKSARNKAHGTKSKTTSAARSTTSTSTTTSSAGGGGGWDGNLFGRERPWTPKEFRATEKIRDRETDAYMKQQEKQHEQEWLQHRQQLNAARARDRGFGMDMYPTLPTGLENERNSGNSRNSNYTSSTTTTGTATTTRHNNELCGLIDMFAPSCSISSSSSSSGSGGSGGSRRASPAQHNVGSYTRSNGTVVASYTRGGTTTSSSSSSGSGGSGGSSGSGRSSGCGGSSRASPAQHTVGSYTRSNGTVVASYTRGGGGKN